MSEEKRKENDIENLYVSDEPKTFEIKGVTITFKELSGIEFTELTDEMGIDPTKPDELSSKDYMFKLIDKCVIEPELDVERLKTDVLVKIMNEIQGDISLDSDMENLS